jgi:hypothetical protein
MKLPVYELMISDDVNDDAEVNFVALVDRPAIQKNWNAFKEKVNFQIASEDKRIISGAIMLADVPIYRRDNHYGEYFVTFSKETIFKIVKKYFKKGFQGNVNLEHNPNQKQNDVFVFESFISDKERGILPMKGFEDAPDGSWFGSMYVGNDQTWKEIKEGKYKGFSVEGLFNYSIKKQEAQDRDEIIMNQIYSIISQVTMWDESDVERDEGGRFAPKGGGSGGGAKESTKATPEQEVKSGDPKLIDLMNKAKEAAPEIDKMSRGIADKYGADITPINLKSEESIIRKANDEEKGDLSQIKDSVRNTIVHEDKETINKIIGDLEKDPSFMRVKVQDAETNSLGYSGNIVNVRGSNGVIAEIQVNTPKMIYAKEKPENAIRTIGKEKYDQIAKKFGIAGGKGHTLYEEYRKLDPFKDSKRMREIEKESKAYYKNFLD